MTSNFPSLTMTIIRQARERRRLLVEQATEMLPPEKRTRENRFKLQFRAAFYGPKITARELIEGI